MSAYIDVNELRNMNFVNCVNENESTPAVKRVLGAVFKIFINWVLRNFIFKNILKPYAFRKILEKNCLKIVKKLQLVKLYFGFPVVKSETVFNLEYISFFFFSLLLPNERHLEKLGI